MAWIRPTLKELKDRINADVESSIDQEVPLLRKAYLRVLAAVFAGSWHLQHGYLQWLSRQIFPFYAEGEYLEKHAEVWGITRKPATYATGPVTVTAEPGSAILAGAVAQGKNRIEYEVIESVTVGLSGSATIQVEASTAGSIGNLAEAETLTFIEPIAGVQSIAVVASGGIADGNDVETDDSLRERILLRIQEPPRGGSKADYEFWAREVSGVTRAWCYPTIYGAGTVGLTFVTDDSIPIVPNPAKIAEVQAYIEDPTRKPAAAVLFVFAPAIKEVDFTIKLTPDTPEIRASVEAELDAFLRRSGEPGATLPLSKFSEAISGAPGEDNHIMYEPSAPVTLTNLEVAARGTMTYV